MIKEFILKIGEKLINTIVVIGFISVFLIGIVISSQAKNFGEGLLMFLLVEIIGIAYLVLIFFLCIFWWILETS